MKTPVHEPLELWHAVPYLQGLPDVVIGELAAVATRHVYAQGSIIFMEGEASAGLYLVEHGAVKICRFAADGREHILHVTHSGDTFNDVSALDGGANPACAMAFSDATLWRVTRPDLHRVVNQNPALAWALIEDLARRARYLVGVVQDLAMRNVRGRLARLLLDQAEAVEQGAQPEPLTQEEMANRLGTVREVVGRSLRSLSAANIIAFNRQQIVIVDRARLQQEAEV